MRVSIIGGSGYAGGELLRLLLNHPDVEVNQATSESHLGEYVYQQHPNLRKQTKLKFTSRTVMEPCDVLFLALPHGETQKNIDQYAKIAPKIIDLSADFRLRDLSLYKKFYESDHQAAQWIERFIYGLPELHREEMKTASYISGVGCNATASIMSLYVGVKYGFVDPSQPIFIEIKVGSSEGGASVNPGSHHPERSNVVRTFAPYGHRHTAEVMQELGLPNVHLTMTSVDLIRGALATAHAFVKPGVTEKDLWKAYREWSEAEPFIRLVKDRRGIYRVPEPKILAGTNFVDVGFDLDPETGHLVGMAAIDNLMKGAAGSAVQAMNIMCGFKETAGLDFCGLHPI
ncbi:MAG: N-acetyl-gamma-glutamyl-phosphate reductase [Leptolinea sp.]|jgi:N-acetyl-gamma-glutamyl-phosphate/LysW-gamma-L-alpha-aminoadipyl-6-phosphate reductase|nr:N-acetyl-gamma-glutamyl-phosphate reductase [Leptolinea sp.]